MTNTGGSSRTRSIAGNILMALPASALAVSALVKFALVPRVVQKMTVLGFGGGKLTLVAILEIASALLFIFTKSRSFGLLFLSAFLGGAVCAHVQVGQFADAAGPAVILALAWAGAWLRHPEMMWSLKEREVSS